MSHSPRHLREDVLELIEGKEFLSDKEKTKRLYDLLGKLWNCTDLVPADQYRNIVADCLEPYCSDDVVDSIKPADLTYALLARNFRPVLRVLFDLKK